MLELKSVMLLLKKNAEYSTTASGSSTYSVEYENEFDLNESMEELLIQMNKNYLQQRV